MALSPMMKHYLQVKEEYKDCIIFYRLGDFYEMFYDDAKTGSKVLDLTLTGRDCGLEERAPMCGVPFHAAEAYISRLVDKGYKVAICEQISEPEPGKIVERAVIKVITPGTITDPGMLNDRKNNFVASIYMGKKDQIGLSWVDITTGEFNMLGFAGEDALTKLNDTLLAIAPREIVANTDMCLVGNNLPVVKLGSVPKFSSFADGAYLYSHAVASILEQLKIGSIVVLDCQDKPQGVSSAGALIEYLKQTQKRTLAHINTIQVLRDGNFMYLDNTARRNLELTETMRDRKTVGSLLWVLDSTFTSMGARLIRKWIEQPLQNHEHINLRLDSVEELVNKTVARQSLVEQLEKVRDIERLSSKICSGTINPRDCIALLESFKLMPKIKAALKGFESALIVDAYNNMSDFKELSDLLERSIDLNAPVLTREGGYIKKGFDAELDKLKNASSDGQLWLAQLEAKERELTGIRTLKVGYNQIHGYYIEVSKLNKDLVPYRYTRRQTLINAERFITDELKSIEDTVLGAQEKAIRLEKILFDGIVDKMGREVQAMQRTAAKIALVDALVSLAIAAVQNGYVRPVIKPKDGIIKINGGRHPVVERLPLDERFVPNDTVLDNNENRTLIITGPNMAGKSTYMRQVALITLMAHCGSFVPADSAEISVVDRIFTRVGASDDLGAGQSTFMVEMIEMANILRNATEKSLLILDEIGRGTSTFDGLSIAWAVVEFVVNKIKAKTLFATHYHELSELEGRMEGVKNYCVTVKELNNSIVFLHKILRGGSNRSFGVEVASLAGLPEEVTQRARDILHTLEQSDLNNSPLARKAKDPENRPNDLTKAAEQIIQILKQADLNNMSPMNAFELLANLKKKL